MSDAIIALGLRNIAQTLRSIADTFGTYGSDQDACIAKGWVQTRADKEACRVKAETWRDAESELRRYADAIVGPGTGAPEAFQRGADALQELNALGEVPVSFGSTGA